MATTTFEEGVYRAHNEWREQATAADPVPPREDTEARTARVMRLINAGHDFGETIYD